VIQPDPGHVSQKAQGHGAVNLGLVFEQKIEKHRLAQGCHLEQQVGMGLLKTAFHKGSWQGGQRGPIHPGREAGREVILEKPRSQGRIGKDALEVGVVRLGGQFQMRLGSGVGSALAMG
jgi:hypothetical protein